MSENTYTKIAENIVYDNDNYVVIINDDGDGYGVMNERTGVVEFEAIALPECIFAAENLNVVLIFETYKWIGKQAQAKADKEEAEVSKLATVTELLN